MKPTTCKRCGDAIFWVVTTTGSKMPLDMYPHRMGNVYLLDSSVSTPLARVKGKKEPTILGEPRWRAHFVTCRGLEKKGKHGTDEKQRSGTAVDSESSRPVEQAEG